MAEYEMPRSSGLAPQEIKAAAGAAQLFQEEGGYAEEMYDLAFEALKRLAVSDGALMSRNPGKPRTQLKNKLLR